jgi:hypothetical protein
MCRTIIATTSFHSLKIFSMCFKSCHLFPAPTKMSQEFILFCCWRGIYADYDRFRSHQRKLFCGVCEGKIIMICVEFNQHLPMLTRNKNSVRSATTTMMTDSLSFILFYFEVHRQRPTNVD